MNTIKARRILKQGGASNEMMQAAFNHLTSNVEKKTLLIINGMPGSGKSTFLEKMQIREISWKDPAVEVLQSCLFDYEKSKHRKITSDITKALEKYGVQLEYIERTLKDDDLIAVNCREPRNIEKIKERFDSVRIITILVKYNGTQCEDKLSAVDNKSLIEGYNYDYILCRSTK